LKKKSVEKIFMAKMKQIFLEEPVLMLESQFRASLNELPQINSD